MKAFLFPGQGSQRKGMGEELFPKYPEYVKKADEILGYSIETLCISDPENRLNFTAYTQPAIFVVSVLNYLEVLKSAEPPEFAAGHSIGEYAALFAAEAFDFETGLRIVQKRAELMSRAEGGALAAVIGLSLDEVKERIRASNLPGIEIANINSPTQIVVGSKTETIQAFANFSNGQSGRVVVLRVSGAFHTSYMREAQAAFGEFLDEIAFRQPSIQVLSNYTAQIHTEADMRANLANHLANPVRWIECIENLVRAGVDTFTEIGSKILTPMVDDIRDHMTKQQPVPTMKATPLSKVEPSGFCASLGVRKPMVAAGACHGVELISKLAASGILSFLDTDGQSPAALEHDLKILAADSALAGKYGVSLAFNVDAPDSDNALIELCLRHAVRAVEIRGYFEPSAALLRYRLEGGLDVQGRPHHRIMLRADEPDVLTSFMEPFSGLASSEKTSSSNPIYDFPLIDAVCVNAKSSKGLEVFKEVLELCQAQNGSKLPFGKIFVGLSGYSAMQKPIETALEQGADFALVSSMFLLAKEARLDDSIKIELSRATEQHFREVFDWRYPECRTSSFGYVLSEETVEQVSALLELYSSDGLNAAALRQFSTQYADKSSNVLPESFISTCEGMNKFEIRAALRERAREFSSAHFIECEAPFSDAARWLNAQGVSFPVSAVTLAELIYPKNHIS